MKILISFIFLFTFLIGNAQIKKRVADTIALETVIIPIDTVGMAQDTIPLTRDPQKIISKGDGYMIIDEGYISVVGIAWNDKGGAMIKTDSLIYFIKNLYSWPKDVYNKKVKASGKCIVYDQRILMRHSPSRQGYQIQWTLHDPKWEVIEN